VIRRRGEPTTTSKRTTSKRMSRKPRRTFTEEQRTEAVRIAKASGKPVAQVARELGLCTSALRNWILREETASAGALGTLTSDERAELKQLRKELKRVTMERDFLKKATAYFARETGSASK